MAESIELQELGKEFADQLEKLSLHLTSIQHNEALATSRLKSLQDRQEKTLEKIETIENAKFQNEQELRDKLSQQDGESIRSVKRPKEILFKRGQKEKILQKLKLSEKENQVVKEQLRLQIVRVMKLEARLANYETKANAEVDKANCNRKTPVKKRKFGRMMESFKADFSDLRATVQHVMKVKTHFAASNRQLQSKVNKLMKELDMAKEENFKLMRENQQLIAAQKIKNVVADREATDNDLLLAQLEQENEMMVNELKDAKEREMLWRKHVEVMEKIKIATNKDDDEKSVVDPTPPTPPGSPVNEDEGSDTE